MTRTTKNSAPHRLTPLESGTLNADITLTSLSVKLDDILRRFEAFENRFEKLEHDNVELKVKMSRLEERVDYLENIHRQNNIILSGSALGSLRSADDYSGTVIDLFRGALNYELTRAVLLAAYRVGTKPQDQSPDRRKILVKLANSEVKRDLMAAFRTAKPANLYGNDDLTPAKASLLYKMRQVKVKRSDKVVGCGSRDSKLFMLLKPPAPNARPQRIYVRGEEHLGEICSRLLETSLDILVGVINDK